MYQLLIRLMLLATLAELGMNIFDFETCVSQACRNRIEGAERRILRIDWVPISVFPDEAKGFGK